MAKKIPLTEVDISKGIQVGGFCFQVKKSDRKDKELLLRNHSGECDYVDKCISLYQDMDDIDTSEVFLHETIHAIDLIYNDHRLSEEMVGHLGYGLHQVMESLGIRFVCNGKGRVANERL